MQSIKHTPFYGEVSKELNLHFGNFYFFDGFIVSEIKENTVFTWEYAKIIINEVVAYYSSSGKDIIYISNRIHDYNVNPVDWLKFTRKGLSIKGFGIVSRDGEKDKNAGFESLFVPSNFKIFNDSLEAIQWAASMNDSKAKKKI